MLKKKRRFGYSRLVIGLWLAVAAALFLVLGLWFVFAATTTITDVSTAASTLLNVAVENNFSHLTIGGSLAGGVL